MKRLFNLFLKVVLCLVAALAIRQYFFCPIYNFKENLSFTGNNWYNPYSKLDKAAWKKCNFHAHSKAWSGITNGKGSEVDIWERYQALKYSVNCVSNYHTINTSFKVAQNFLSAYEHGYNMMKAHQLVLGGNQVIALDYFFPQTLSNKQNILNWLKTNDNYIAICHPNIRKAYQSTDFKYLSRYDCIEIMSPYIKSFDIWDAALSAGRPIFGIANDDTHNIFNDNTIGNYCSWLNVDTLNSNSIIKALKYGKFYSMQLPKNKAIVNEDLPSLEYLNISDNHSISIKVNKNASTIRFIGQNGMVLSTTQGNSANYALLPTDSYIRIEILFDNEVMIALNPIFRYNTHPFEAKDTNLAEVNWFKTIFFHTMGVLATIVIGILLFSRNSNIYNKLSLPKLF